MSMREYPILQLDTNYSKRTAHLLLVLLVTTIINFIMLVLKANILFIISYLWSKMIV